MSALAGAAAGRSGALTVLAGENQKSGPIGLAVILALAVVCYLLFRSMSRHMRKVREEFPDAPAAGGIADHVDPRGPATSGPPPADRVQPPPADRVQPPPADRVEPPPEEDAAR
jgi:hypothetical protein